MKKIRILSWNVNGIRAVQKKGFTEWMLDEQPDVLCLQETKANKNQLDDEILNIDDYNAYFSTPERKGYSGVAIYTKEMPVAVEYNLGFEEFDSEGRIIVAEYKNFVLLNVYFPNGKQDQERLDYKMRFYAEFLKYINQLKSQGKNVIFCGDVNTAHKEIDLSNPKANMTISGFLPQERAWIDKVIADGFLDTFRLVNSEPENYTWWDYRTGARERNIGWRLDYFFVSENLRQNITDAFILKDVLGSDHCPVGIEVKI